METKQKSVSENIALHKLSWGATQDAAVQSSQDLLHLAVWRVFPKEDSAISIYTETSEKCWEGIIRQTDKDKLAKKIELQ